MNPLNLLTLCQMEHMRIISIEVKVSSIKTVYVQQCTAKLLVALVDYMPDNK